MTEYDPRRSLEDIDRYGNSSRDAYVQQNTALPYMVPVAVMLLLVYGSLDLPSPWNVIITVAGLVLGLGAATLAHVRAPVRRRPSPAELGLYLGWGVLLIVVYGAVRVGAYGLDLPVPGMIAAVIMAVVSVVSIVAMRPLIRSLMRREARRG